MPMSNRTVSGYGECQVAGETPTRSQHASSTKSEDLLVRTEKEISRKIFDIETITCLRAGFKLEDRARYLAMLELRKRVHRASLTVQTMRVLEREMEEVAEKLKKKILREEEVLLSVREVQAQSMEYFLSRLRG